MGVKFIDEAYIYKVVMDVLQSKCGIEPMYLENCTDNAQMPLPEKGEPTMAKHRMRVCIGYNDDGSPVEKMVSGNTQRELADKIVWAILNSERRSEFLEKNGITKEITVPINKTPTFKAYVDQWMNTYKVGKLRPKTLKGYNDKIKCHLLPAFGDMPLTEITTEKVQAMLNERNTYSHKTLQEVLTLLRQILNSAVSDRLIDNNPAADKRIYNPSKVKNERDALSFEDWRDVVNSLDRLEGFDRLYMAIVAFTGMRRGEVLGLRWEDIDLHDNVIHVRRNVTHTSNAPIIGEPKTEKGKRDVPIMEGLKKYLVPMKESGYIVSRDKAPDEPLTFSAYDNMWRRINDTIDLHGATSHVFRHTLGTILYETGTDIKTIQSLVGHADYSTTMNTYVHARDDRKQAAMAKINDQISA